MKTALYARNSIKEEIQKTSIRSQITEGEMAALKHKLFIDEKYLDREVSARSKSRLQRPELHRLLSDIRSGLVQNVLVNRRCRLARNLSEHLEIYEIFWKHRINVIFTGEGEPPMIYSEEGEILESVFGAKNEVEGNKIVDGIKAGQRAKAKEGRKPNGVASYGYRAIETDNKKEIGTLKKEEEEEKVVLNMFNLFLSKDFPSFASFVKYIKSQKNIPSEWSDSRVRGMFSNQLYNGFLYYKDEPTPVPHLRMIDDEPWGRIQDKYASRYSTGRKNEKHNVVFLLENKVYCTLCGQLMKTRKYNYKDVEGFYVCEEHGRKIKKNELEKEYLQEAKKYLLNEFPITWEKMYPTHLLKKTDDLENQLYDLEFHLANLGQSLIEWTRIYMHDKSGNNKNELKSLRQKYNSIQKDISSKKAVLEKFKKMAEYSSTTLLEAANFELQARLSSFQEDELVIFLLSLNTGIKVYPHSIKIYWDIDKEKYNEVRL